MTALRAVQSIAILRHIRTAEIIPVAQALAQAGIDVIEVTLNTDGALGMIETLARLELGNVIIGAGTVTVPEQAQQIADAGGEIAISPNTDTAVISATKKAGLLSLPGCLTPSEAFAAVAAGADGLKIFPCEMAPPAAIKALKAVLPGEIPVFAVGGISVANTAEYLQAGAQGVGLGSSLYKPGKSIADIRDDALALCREVG